MKKYIAEALGTFTLTLAVALSLAGDLPIPTPVIAALVLGLFVYSIGHISGTHINPAVTIGLWSIKKIETKTAIGYIIAQVIGSCLAWIGLCAINSANSAVFSYAVLNVGNDWIVALAEIVGTFFFAFGIASVVYGRAPKDASGLVIGGSLLLGITLAALLGSNGVLNPAVAIGIQSSSFMYIIAPIIGSVLGMQVYKRLG